ncbi:histidinol-phosphatase [Candidatus Nitrospira bockiana]
MSERNRQLAAIFQSIADLLETGKENPYRVRAYRRGASALLRLDEDVASVAERGGLENIPGIGKDLASKIDEFLKTGRIGTYEQLKRPLPPDVARWLRLPGLTEPAVHHLYHRLGIRTLEDLKTLVRSHLLRTLPGITVSEDDLLAAIQTLEGDAKP